MKKKLLILLGLRIKKLREEKGISQTDLAYSIAKDQQSIQRLEKGRVNPSFYYLYQIAQGLEIEIDELLKDLH